jgi:anti-sigma-K factor RskA
MSDDDIDMLAAEYVLGTLDGAERGRVQGALAHDAPLARAVERWLRYLSPLIGAGPVPVPAHVWRGIEARL